MKESTTVGPDGIPIEVWVLMDDIRIDWSTKLLDKILGLREILDGWRKSTVVLFYKNERGIQNYENYQAIKLVSYMMKSCESNREMSTIRIKCSWDLIWVYADWIYYRCHFHIRIYYNSHFHIRPTHEKV